MLFLAREGKTLFLRLFVTLFIAINIFVAYLSAAEIYCGEIKITPAADGAGPWDYSDSKNITNGNRALVENEHFTTNVENLVRGKTTLSPLPDLEYTVYRFPNHHRALWALSRFQRKNKGTLPTRSVSSFAKHVECYFEKATIFKPRDGVVQMLYAMHLHMSGDMDLAEQRYKIAEKMLPESSELAYNFGLFYFEIKNYGAALEYAKKAYGTGYPMLGLRTKLEKVGEWQD